MPAEVWEPPESPRGAGKPPHRSGRDQKPPPKVRMGLESPSEGLGRVKRLSGGPGGVGRPPQWSERGREATPEV